MLLEKGVMNSDLPLPQTDIVIGDVYVGVQGISTAITYKIARSELRIYEVKYPDYPP